MKFKIDENGEFICDYSSITSELEFDIYRGLVGIGLLDDENIIVFDDEDCTYSFWWTNDLYYDYDCEKICLTKEILKRDFGENIRSSGFNSKDNFHRLSWFYHDYDGKFKELFNKMYKEGIEITKKLKNNISEKERYINIMGYKYLIPIDTAFNENLFEEYEQYLVEEEEKERQRKLEEKIRKEEADKFFNSIDKTELRDGKRHIFKYKEDTIVRYYYSPNNYTEKIIKPLTEEEKKELEDYYKYLEYKWEHEDYDDYYYNNSCDTLNEDDDDYWLGRYHMD